MLDDRIAALVGSIYEAPYEDARWQQMAHDVRSVLDCHALLISTVDTKKHSLSSTAWYGPDDSRFLTGIDEYREEFYRLDPTIGYAARYPSAKFCDVLDIVNPADLATDPYMNWYRDRFRSPTFAVCYSPPDDGLTFGVSAHPGFGHDDLDHELFRFLADHVARSVALAARPPRLEGETEAVILVRASGKVVALSPQAERYLAEADGLRLANGRIEASLERDAKSLERALAAASAPAESGSSGSTVFVSRPSHRRNWVVSVVPMPGLVATAAAFQAKAMIRIVDPARQRSLSDELCSRFGFTLRERQIADLLLCSHSLASAARCLDISENTLKVHLQALFRKTETNRQVELVKLLTELCC